MTYDDADGTFDFVVPATGRTAAQVDASITAAFTAAVTGNTETRINVEYDPDDGTLDFVVDDPPGLTEAEVDTRITNAFAAAVTNNTETGIVVTYNSGDGTYDFVVSGMTPGPPSDDIYFGTSGNDTPSGSELTVAAVNGVGTILAYTGERYLLLARLATEDDFTSVLFSDDNSNTNQIGAFAKFSGTVTPTGETLPFNVWVSNQAIRATN